MRSAVALSAAGFPGASTALGELADATGQIHAVTLGGGNPRSPEGQFVRALIDAAATRLLVVGGWSPVYEPFVAAAARRGVPVAMYWTSTAGQTGMSVEAERLVACLVDTRIAHHWFIQRSLAETLYRAIPSCVWMPAVLAPRAHRRAGRASAGAKRVVNVGLFCSPNEYARKNVLTTLAAVARLGPRVVLHLNGLSSDAVYRPWLDRLGIRWIDHGWMSRDAYIDTIAGLDIGLQVSFAESFNYVAADHILAGVPVVVSPMVPAVTQLPPRLVSPFVVPNADDPAAVADAIVRVLDRPRWARQRTQAIRTALVKSQGVALTRARRILRHAIGGSSS